MAAISLKPNSKGITALIVIAVIIFFGCVLGYMAAAGKMKSTATELEAKQKKVTESEQIAQKLEQSKLNYYDACSQIRFLESSVSNSAYVPTLLKQLEFLGKSVNLKVIGVRPQPVEVVATQRKITSGKDAANGNVEAASQTQADPNGNAAQKPAQKPAPYDELKVDIEVEGKYMSALDFLYKLTSFPKIIAVNSVQMNPSSGSLDNKLMVGSPTLNIKVNVTAFVFKDDKPTSAPKPAAAPVTTTSITSERSGGNEAG